MESPELSETVIIIGAGPAGCNCAVWLALQGIPCTLIERAPSPMNTLLDLDFKQDWVLGHPQASARELAKNYLRHVQSFKEIQIYCDQPSPVFKKIAPQNKQIQLSNGDLLEGAALVFATGLRPKRPSPYFPEGAPLLPMDAIQLTKQRTEISNKRVLLLGGGDNAAENAIYLAENGNSVVLWARNSLRAQPNFQARIQRTRQIQTRAGIELPRHLSCLADQWVTESTSHGTEYFDHAAVLFGFEPDDSAWCNMQDSEAWIRDGVPGIQLSNHEALNAHGIFLAGDISQRMHPCIQTALADGVTASKQVNEWLRRHP